jgi:hypothetical protein
LLAKVKEEIYGGVISCRTGHNDFMQVLAIKACCDEYRLDLLCAFHAACACIQRGVRDLHLPPDEENVHSALLAIRRPLEHIDLYRSSIDLLRYPELPVSAACRGFMRRYGRVGRKVKKGESDEGMLHACGRERTRAR